MCSTLRKEDFNATRGHTEAAHRKSASNQGLQESGFLVPRGGSAPWLPWEEYVIGLLESFCRLAGTRNPQAEESRSTAWSP